MAAPTQIAVIDLEHHDGRTPDAGSYTARILNIGPETGGSYTLSGADVAAGALVVPLVPVSALVSAPVLTVENIGEEPVITASDGDISVTIATGVYAGTYTTRHDGAPLTTAMIEAAPTCLLKPAVTGTTGLGDTLTITPGLWLYAGADPGDQSWVHKLNGVATSETGLDYIIRTVALGKNFTVDETFDGVTVTSAALSIPLPSEVLVDVSEYRSNYIAPSNVSATTADESVTMDFGPADTGRRLVVMAAGLWGVNEPELTIDGVSATPFGPTISVDGGDVRGWYLDSDTIGGAVTVNLSNFTAGTHLEIAFFGAAMRNVATQTVYSDAATGGATSLSIDVADGATIMGLGISTNGSSATWVGATEQFDNDIRSSEFVSGVLETSMTAETGRTVSATTSAGQSTLVVHFSPS